MSIVHRQSKGVALVIAVLVLAALTTLLATLAVRVTMAKRRQEYRIEYQRARYALDSAMKYALSSIPEKTFALAEREGLPDFSDLFWMDANQRQAYLSDWLATATDEAIEKVLKPESSAAALPELGTADLLTRLAGLFGSGDDADAESTAMPPSDDAERLITADDILIYGPYTADWPNVIEPIELEIGTAKVTIYIEDENAKLPLSWAMTSDQEAHKKAQAVLSVFYDWIGLDDLQRQTLAMQLEQIQQQKAFELNPNPILLTAVPPTAQPPRAAGRRSRRRRSAPQPAATTAAAAPQQRPASAHATDFAKLFHSALLDRQIFALPAVVRQEDVPAQTPDSPLRYIGLWGAQRVNVNTAPRHVLEAALTFGGDAVELTEKIIQQRQVEPFKDLDDLKQKMFGYSALIDRAKDYLTTTSNFYSIRVVSTSGNARATAVATVIKEGKKVEQLAILYGL